MLLVYLFHMEKMLQEVIHKHQLVQLQVNLFFSLKNFFISTELSLGVSLINYRPIPWSISGLLAHELAHTLSVIHPNELQSLCESHKNVLDFCKNYPTIPAQCACNSNDYPAKFCLMTMQFGGATGYAPKYTPCDIQMINYFSSQMSCLTQVKLIK